MPFGRPSTPGQTIPAHARPTGAIYRANPDGTDLEVYAWGIRSPFGFAFGPDGRLYMTDENTDDKGARPVANVPEVLWAIQQNGWYGWPDYMAGIPVTDNRFRPRLPGSKQPGFVMREHPEVQQPLVRLDPHATDMKFDWSHSDRFGFNGEMFMAEFGDGAPLNTGLKRIPHQGFRIVRVNPAAGTFEPFMTIRNPGLETTRGPKRPADVRFDPSGDNLYLLDFGILTVRLSAKQVGINPPIQTGTVWRIRRQDAGPAPAPWGPEPRVMNPLDRARLLSWWTVRTSVLGIQKDLRVAAIHAARGRNGDILAQPQHIEEARSQLEAARTQAMLALKRIDGPEVTDDGTKVLLMRVMDYADAHDPFPLGIYSDDPVIRAVHRWVERTAFPEKDELFKNYAEPGRWQRPLEEDVSP